MCSLMKNRKICFAAMSSAVVFIVFLFIDPVFAIYMQIAFGLDVITVGAFLFVLGAGYLVGCIVFDLLVRRFRRRVIMHAGALISVPGVFLLGPSEILELPESLMIISAGLVITGIGCGMFITPLM